MPLDVLQIWDCFSYDVSATGFDRLSEMRVRAYLKDRQWYPGRVSLHPRLVRQRGRGGGR